MPNFPCLNLDTSSFRRMRHDSSVQRCSADVDRRPDPHDVDPEQRGRSPADYFAPSRSMLRICIIEPMAPQRLLSAIGATGTSSGSKIEIDA